MAEKKIEKCAHPGCNCPAAPSSQYCGAYCEGSRRRPRFDSDGCPAAVNLMAVRFKEGKTMCDYSLAGIPNRLAVEGEQLMLEPGLCVQVNRKQLISSRLGEAVCTAARSESSTIQ
jgi:hypothetical protein